MAWLTSARDIALKFGPGVALRIVDGGREVVVHEVEQWDACDFGGDDGPGEIVILEAAGLGAEEVQGADVFTGDEDGHREDATDLVGEQGGAVDGPAVLVGVGEIGDEDRAAGRDGIQAGAFAEGELEFVVGPGGRTAGAESSAAGTVEHQ